MNIQTTRRILLGLLLIGFGGLFLAGQLGYIDIDPSVIIPTYWPVILILLGLNSLIGIGKDRGSNSFLWSLFLIMLGVFFLLRNLGYTQMDIGDAIKTLIPVIIIVFGVRMILKPAKKPRPNHQEKDYSYKYEYKYDSHYDSPPPADPLSVSSDPQPAPGPGPDPSSASAGHTSHSYSGHNGWRPNEDRSGFIGDLYLGNDYWELKPMNVSHFIGDTTIDLTKAQIPMGETKVNISAFIGDVKVFVPNDVDVEFDVNSSSFLGDITVFNRKESGLLRAMREVTPSYAHSDRKIKLTCNLFIGDIQIQRVG